jgi:hypothetical protein
LGTDVCNELALYIATESNLNYTTNQLSIEQRNKIAQECGKLFSKFLRKLTINQSIYRARLQGCADCR